MIGIEKIIKEGKKLNKDYELLETFKKDKETWSYLRHKKTGLEIAYHQYETWESGFSFTFRTPIEEQYLGTRRSVRHIPRRTESSGGGGGGFSGGSHSGGGFSGGGGGFSGGGGKF